MIFSNKNNTDIVKSNNPFFGGLFHKKELRNMVLKKDINLLPRKILEQRRFDESFRKMCLMSIKLLILACAILVVPYIHRLTLSFDKNSLETRIQQISSIEELEKRTIESRGQLKSKRELITKLNKNDSVISNILTTMEKVIPKSMYLTSVKQETSELKQADIKMTELQKIIKIKGVAKDKDSVAEFQKSLRDTNLYKEVFVTNISEVDEQKQNVIQVTVKNEVGDILDKEIPLTIDFRVKVEFVMECILNDWK